jgi:hypothetical protein
LASKWTSTEGGRSVADPGSSLPSALSTGPAQGTSEVASLLPTLDARANGYLDRCLRVLDSLQEPPGAELEAIEREGALHWSQPQIAALHRELGRRLLLRNARRLAEVGPPDDFPASFETEFERINTELQQKPFAHFTFANYRFKADMRILSLRRIPAGMYDLEVSGVPRRLFGRQGPAAALRLARVIATAGGFSPFFTQHLVPHRMHLFSPVERGRFLRRTAALLLRRPEIRGLISTAWYNDPAIAKFSPRLAYLREGFETWGSGVFRIGTSAAVAKDAVAYSFERRRVVETGQYVPTAYLGIALRRQILRLAAEGA